MTGIMSIILGSILFSFLIVVYFLYLVVKNKKVDKKAYYIYALNYVYVIFVLMISKGGTLLMTPQGKFSYLVIFSLPTMILIALCTTLLLVQVIRHQKV